MKRRTNKPFRRGEVEQPLDSVELNEVLPEEFRDTSNQLEEHDLAEDTTHNPSQAEDRGEDLINETDPFIQQPERNTRIPPELIQQRAYQLYEQRGSSPGDNLADWFEAERQLREEHRGL